MLKKDKVKEFSVVPSANPLDHFMPEQVPMVTSAGFDHLAQKLECNYKLVDSKAGLYKYVPLGVPKGPNTLIISVEMVLIKSTSNKLHDLHRKLKHLSISWPVCYVHNTVEAGHIQNLISLEMSLGNYLEFFPDHHL